MYYIAYNCLYCSSVYVNMSFLYLMKEKTTTSVLFQCKNKRTYCKRRETRETAETGNVLLSTHLLIQMSTPLRNPPHVNIMSSGHDPLLVEEIACMGNRLLESPEPFTVSMNVLRPPSTPLQNTES